MDYVSDHESYRPGTSGEGCCPRCAARQRARAVDREMEIIGSRDSRKQRRKNDMKAAPFRYICDLEYDFPTIGRKPWMTGFLVGPSTVLTAGHLIDSVEATEGPFDARRIGVIPGRRGTYRPFASADCSGYKRRSDYSPVTPTDYMLLFLKKKIGNSVGYWGYSHKRQSFDALGTSTFQGGGLPKPAGRLKVNVCGYPDDKPTGQGCRKSGKRCNQTGTTDPGRGALCGTYQYSAFDRTVSLSGDMLRYENDTCSGNSGSPVWIKRSRWKGGRVLVGLHVGGGSSSNVAVLINPALRAFLRANVR